MRGGPLNDGTEYYYSVRAYGYSPTEKLAVVENAQEPLRVIPQRPALGTDPATANASVTYSRTDPGLAPATDRIDITVVDRDSLKGYDYGINFAPMSASAIQSESPEILTKTVVIHFFPNSWDLFKKVTKDKNGKAVERGICRTGRGRCLW